MSSTRTTRIIVRNSKIHGRGVYAARKLKAGEKVIEYRGERITWKEADRRPPSDPDDPHHTFFFSLSDGKTVIDAASRGNAARWINHSCKPSCEPDEENGRVFIKAIRDIKAGEELNYDYGLVIDAPMTKELKLEYPCWCGAKKCRGTLLSSTSEFPKGKESKAKKSDKKKSNKKSEKAKAKKG